MKRIGQVFSYTATLQPTLGHRSDDDDGGGGDTFINLSANGDKFNEYEMIQYCA